MVRRYPPAIYAANPDQPVTYALWIHDGENEPRLIMRYYNRAGGSRSMNGDTYEPLWQQSLTPMDEIELAGDRVRLIYRPDPEAARYTVDVFELPDHEIIVEDVPVDDRRGQ